MLLVHDLELLTVKASINNLVIIRQGKKVTQVQSGIAGIRADYKSAYKVFQARTVGQSLSLAGALGPAVESEGGCSSEAGWGNRSLLVHSGPWQFVLWHYTVAEFNFLLSYAYNLIQSQTSPVLFFQTFSIFIETHTSMVLKGYQGSLRRISYGNCAVKIYIFEWSGKGLSPQMRKLLAYTAN